MNLVLQREILTSQSTIGQLSIDDEFFCWTLEDVVRAPGAKIKGSTAIPVGKYRLAITESARFGKPLPLLLDVVNFSGIRIHSGNTSEDTEGCILIGLQKGVDSIGRSQAAMALFMPKLEAALQDGGEVWIEVKNP